MGVRWISFDCYGTLVDWNAGFAAILRPRAGERTHELFNAYHRHEPRVQAERPFRSYKEVLTISLARAAAEIGMQLTEEDSRLLSQQWSRLPVFGDVEPALANLRAAGFKLGVLTNCDEDLFAQTQCSLALRFDRVITAEQVRDYKPSPAHFRFFEDSASVNRDDWVHVACSWFHDIEPARELGIRHIWLDREQVGEQASKGTVRVLSAAALPETIPDIFESQHPGGNVD